VLRLLRHTVELVGQSSFILASSPIVSEPELNGVEEVLIAERPSSGTQWR
jgi:hypothetical protein